VSGDNQIDPFSSLKVKPSLFSKTAYSVAVSLALYELENPPSGVKTV